MSLITKRLSTLAAGTEIQVSYGFVEVQNLVVTETVTDNDNTACLEVRDSFCKQFNTDALRVSPEKVDVYIAANWEAAGKLIPSRESATLQGTRRNALRSAISPCWRLWRTAARSASAPWSATGSPTTSVWPARPCGC